MVVVLTTSSNAKSVADTELAVDIANTANTATIAFRNIPNPLVAESERPSLVIPVQAKIWSMSSTTTPHQITRDADIERTVPFASHHIDAGLLHGWTSLDSRLRGNDGVSSVVSLLVIPAKAGIHALAHYSFAAPAAAQSSSSCAVPPPTPTAPRCTPSRLIGTAPCPRII